jgi:hypothetical protein
LRQVLLYRANEQALLLVRFRDGGKVQARGIKALRREADVRKGGRPRLIEIHPADDEERDCKPGLCGRREPLEAADSLAAAGGTTLERRDDCRPAEANRGQQAEHHAGDEAQRDALQKQSQVRLEHLDRRVADTEGPRKEWRGAEEQRSGKTSAEDRHDQRFAQVILHETPAARPHGQPHRQFALTHRAAYQHHARDVQADDEEDDARQSEHHEPGAADLRT